MADKHRKALKEKLFVQVAEVDKTPTFVDVTSALGKPVAFTNPLATCAVRVTGDAVFFSMLKLSKRTREAVTKRPLAMPPGPLARLERKLDQNVDHLAPATLLATISSGDTDYTATFAVHTDTAGIATLSGTSITATTGANTVEGTNDPDTTVFELPRTAITITLFVPGVKGRWVAATWVGYLNRPDTKETVTRAVAQALNHLCGLNYFQIITGLATVKVPAPPGKFTVAAVTRSASDKVACDVPVFLWPEGTGDCLAKGTVHVEVDLDEASPSSNRLLLHTTPDSVLAEHFETYRPAFDRTVHDEIVTTYGVDEIDDLVCDIVLGDLASGQLERLKAAPARLSAGVHLSPKKGMLVAAGTSD